MEIENSNQSNCQYCGRPSASCQSAGRITQWIFACTCLADNTEEKPVLSLTISLCSICGKRFSGYAGTMTQWIFGAERCNCLRPARIEQNVCAFVEEISEEDERPLDVDRLDFPVERYLPIAELGVGASSTVYLCQDKMLSKRVALKILHRLGEEQLVAFQKEARTLSVLSHPNIITVLDFGASQGGAPYMVMEYFKGMALNTYLSEFGTLTEAKARDLFAKIAAALSHSHSHNILHRDIKPANILFCDGVEGVDVKLIDFGVAFLKEKSGFVTAFQDKMLVGTPAYMAPDEISGLEYDARSDIYSLGCVMFEALTGRPPFEAESPLAILAKHADVPPPHVNESLTPGVSDQLNQLVRKCLEKDKSDRFGSMEELQKVLLEEKPSNLGAEPNETAANLPIDKKNHRVALRSIIFVGALLIGGACTWGLMNQFALRISTSSKSLPTTEADLPTAAYTSATDDGEKELNQPEDRDALWYQQAASNGDPEAQIALGEIYYNRKNYKEAYQWFRKAADSGNALAQYWLSICYLWGYGVKQDKRQAFYWAEKGASKGNVKAEYRLADYYYGGTGVAKDRVKAFQLCQLAADKGYPLALHRMATSYASGSGTTRDQGKAFQYFEKAAATGLAKSQYYLGLCYLNGAGTEKDRTKAVECFTKAADQQHKDAQFRLADCYWNGLGVPKNRRLARHLYEEAAKNGSQEAKVQLARFGKSNLR